MLGAGFRVLVGCEESQEVTKAFRELGYEAYSCDLQECSGGHPEWHLQMSVFDAIELIKPQLGIFHPPCTFMSRAGARWMYPKAGEICSKRLKLAMEAKEFFMKCLNADIDIKTVEQQKLRDNSVLKVNAYYRLKNKCSLPNIIGQIKINLNKFKPNSEEYFKLKRIIDFTHSTNSIKKSQILILNEIELKHKLNFSIPMYFFEIIK